MTYNQIHPSAITTNSNKSSTRQNYFGVVAAKEKLISEHREVRSTHLAEQQDIAEKPLGSAEGLGLLHWQRTY